jgi:hypothetical protein
MHCERGLVGSDCDIGIFDVAAAADIALVSTAEFVDDMTSPVPLLRRRVTSTADVEVVVILVANDAVVVADDDDDDMVGVDRKKSLSVYTRLCSHVPNKLTRMPSQTRARLSESYK